MKSLKIHLDENASFEKLTELLLQIKGINNKENKKRKKKKTFTKRKKKKKKGEYESIVNDIFDILITKTAK